jgi:hypothetical protein
MAHALAAAMPEGLVLAGEGGAAILGPAAGAVTLEGQATEDGEPIDREELTAILEATSARPSVEEQRRAPTEPVPPPGKRPGKVPVVAGVLALILVAAVVAAMIGLGEIGSTSDGLFGGASARPSIAVVGTQETEMPPATRTPAPTQTPVPPLPTTAAPEPTPTFAIEAVTEPAQTPTAAQTEEPTPADTSTQTATRPATATPAATPTPEPTATQTPQPGPPPADLTGRLAIPLMYGNEPKVYIASTDGELETIVGGARQPDYSGDGTRLIVNGEWGEWDKLRVMGPSGEAAFEIGDPALAGHSFPSWSPDGSRVIYEDATVDPKGPRIFIRDLNSNGPGSGAGDMLTVSIGQGELIGRNPVWASKDRFIFRGCNTWQPGQESECGLWLMQGDAGEPERLTSNPSQVPMDVNGDTLVYVSPEAGDWNVYTLNLASGATGALTTDPAADGAATISPDGRSVAFLSNRGGSLAVWYVSIGGGSPRKFFDLPAEWGGLRENGWADEKLAWGSE